MTDTKQIDLPSLRIQAAHHDGLEITKILTARSQNHYGSLAVSEAQKAQLEEQNAELKKKVAKLEADLAEARGEVSGEPMAGKDGKPGKSAS